MDRIAELLAKLLTVSPLQDGFVIHFLTIPF